MIEPETPDSCLHCLQKCDAFQVLSHTEMESLHEAKYDTVYRPGEVIAKQGAPISHLVSLNEGLVKVVLETPGEQDIIISIERPVFILTGPGLFVDNRYHSSVIALTHCRTCYLEIHKLHRLFDTNPDFAKRFYRNLGERSIMLFNRVRSLNQKNMAGRISEALLSLHKNIFETNPFEMVLTRQELAEITGMTKESVSRILKEFKEEGLIEIEERQIEILDFDKMSSISRKG
jgi:CRP/FNR family transcriptional regulator, polysaccharide utilization system transcription regulator